MVGGGGWEGYNTLDRFGMLATSEVDRGGRQLTKRNAREEWGFGQANEESAYRESSTVGHGRHANGAKTPGHHHGGEKPSRVCLGKPQVAGNLADEISNIERRDACVPQRVGHV